MHLLGLAGIGLRTLASHDSEALTECVGLRADLRAEYDRSRAGGQI